MKAKYDEWEKIMSTGSGWVAKYIWVVENPKGELISETIDICPSWAIFHLIKLPLRFLWTRLHKKGYRLVQFRLVEVTEGEKEEK